MKKFQIFLLTILMLLLAFLTGVISLYALNPDFAAYVNELANKRTEETADIGEEGSEVVEEPEGGAEGKLPEPTETAPEEDSNKDQGSGLTADISGGYSAPEKNALQIPGALSKSCGYEDFKVTEKTVDDEEADRIEEELSTGPTGDELNFDPVFYPYYNMLDDRGKRLYRQIYANIIEMNPAFKSVDRLMTGKRIDNAFEAVFNDHPELFYVDTGYRTVYRRNGDFIELDLFYNETAEDIEGSRSEFEAAASSIISEASGSDYEKERFVHNRLSELFDYQMNPLDQSAYSGLVRNKTVCAGYARSFSYIMTKLGIPCYLCTGYAGEAHGWNIIKLENDYYNVDVTWDDTGTNKPWYYEWFNKTDSDYGSTHIRQSLSVYLPPCNGTKYRGLEADEEEAVPEEEPEDPEADLPSLGSAGFSEQDVIRDMELYYDELYNMIKRSGKGSYSVSMVIDGDMLDECSRAYDDNEVKDRVLGRILEETGGANVNVSCIPTKLKDGYYLLEHKISVY
ncbi:MAG: hypothetical protein IJU87_00435 [Lachnospiraceae bacterium]|nr:hypothetical protein [Lachnospiraceae bacterium]